MSMLGSLVLAILWILITSVSAAQIEQQALISELKGAEVTSLITIGAIGAPRGYNAPYPVNTLAYPNGQIVYRVEWAMMRGEVGQMQKSFGRGTPFQIGSVDFKDDRLELKLIARDRDSARLKVMLGSGWQTRMTEPQVLQTLTQLLTFPSLSAANSVAAQAVPMKNVEQISPQPLATSNSTQGPVIVRSTPSAGNDIILTARGSFQSIADTPPDNCCGGNARDVLAYCSVHVSAKIANPVHWNTPYCPQIILDAREHPTSLITMIYNGNKPWSVTDEVVRQAQAALPEIQSQENAEREQIREKQKEVQRIAMEEQAAEKAKRDQDAVEQERENAQSRATLDRLGINIGQSQAVVKATLIGAGFHMPWACTSILNNLLDVMEIECDTDRHSVQNRPGFELVSVIFQSYRLITVRDPDTGLASVVKRPIDRMVNAKWITCPTTELCHR